MYTSPTKSSFSKNNHGVEFKSSESDSLYFYSYTPPFPPSSLRRRLSPRWNLYGRPLRWRELRYGHSTDVFFSFTKKPIGQMDLFPGLQPGQKCLVVYCQDRISHWWDGKYNMINSLPNDSYDATNIRKLALMFIDGEFGVRRFWWLNLRHFPPCPNQFRRNCTIITCCFCANSTLLLLIN